MNPSTAFGTVVVDELIRCGLRETVLAPGSRSAPLAMAFFGRCQAGGTGPGPRVRLHVRVDERSAGYLALGLAKASGVPAVAVCTSGTAAANFHPAVVEADEACVPLIVLTADRPPELRETGANQAIDQIKLYGSAVRWFCEAGVPEARSGLAAYWRSLTCRAWAIASGAAGGLPGPVHINVGFAEPLVPDGDPAWHEPLGGRPDGAPWTRFPSHTMSSSARGTPDCAAPVALPGAARGVLVCGDAVPDPGGLLAAAQDAGWPVLAEPSSGARQGPNAMSAYPYLLAAPEFVAAHRPDVVVTAGKPGLSRQQLAFIRQAPTHVAIAQGPGRWADPARSVSLVLPAGDCTRGGRGRDPSWLESWRRADAAARAAADQILDSAADSEPRIARDLAAVLPDGALLWAASSLPIRDLDHHMSPRPGLRVLASRGASGIDGLVSTAVGAALSHQAAGGGPAAALLGDLALLHDFGGLSLGPGEPRPDLAIVVVNNDGGGIFSLLEQAAFSGPFERVFGTPHGTDLAHAAAAVRVPYERVERAADLAGALTPAARPGLRLIEFRAGRKAGTALRERLRDAATRAAAAAASVS
jgi:2-succinyl-5-enolpyruvyl-6-hydroxy-3-cyclohexene-1-carboxylate synthase